MTGATRGPHMHLRRLIMTVVCATLLSGVAASAQGLRDLATGDDSKGWHAVGRLNLGDWGFCTGALIAEDLVLTAAHCLYNERTGGLVQAPDLEFRAGWRNGRAEAFRGVKQAVIHPRYSYSNNDDTISRVANDIAILRLDRPIRLPSITPYPIGDRPRKGDQVGVVSYAQERSESPALEEACDVLAGRPGVYMLSCDVNFGSSGAPIFMNDDGEWRIVSVVSSKATVDDRQVALGSATKGSLPLLLDRLKMGENVFFTATPVVRRFGQGASAQTSGGAKFVRP